MQAIFWMLQQLSQNAARAEMMSPRTAFPASACLSVLSRNQKRLAARRNARVNLQCKSSQEL
jgi:hypothetical protein